MIMLFALLSVFSAGFAQARAEIELADAAAAIAKILRRVVDGMICLKSLNPLMVHHFLPLPRACNHFRPRCVGDKGGHQMLRRIRRIQPVLADKVALVLVTILVAGILVSWGLVVTAAGVNGASHVLASTGVSWIENGLIGIGLIWIVLRAIDFARGGPTRALLSMPGIHAHTLHAPSAGKDLAHHC